MKIDRKIYCSDCPIREYCDFSFQDKNTECPLLRLIRNE